MSGVYSMGITRVTVKVSNFFKSATPFEEVFLVDTGAIHCMAPAEKLKAAGVQPEGKRVYELANGQTVEYDYGFVRVTCPAHPECHVSRARVRSTKPPRTFRVRCGEAKSLARSAGFASQFELCLVLIFSPSVLTNLRK